MTAQNKRIALISVHGDPAVEIGKEEAGGQNVYVRQVGEALANDGWQVDMFTRKADAQQETIVEHRPGCRTIRLTAGAETFIPRDEIYQFLPLFVQEFLKFQSEAGIQYPLVHTNYWMSAWVGMQLKQFQPLKQVHTYHSLGAVKYKSVATIPLIAKTRLQVEKAVLETADCVVATSPQEKEQMRTLVSTKGNIEMIPCGTNIDLFGSVSQAEGRERLGISPETKVILYVGRFDRRKGIETLVRAVSLSALRGNNDLKLIIGGGWRPGESDGFEQERIANLVQELGLTEITEFPGTLRREVLPNYYAAADVCVVPSHYEPFGLVAIEAMACCTPVIASDVGGLKFSVLPRQTGLLTPPKDEVALAGAIDRLLWDQAWSRRLGLAGRKRVETYFSWAGVATQIGELYSQLLADPAKTLDPAIA